MSQQDAFTEKKCKIVAQLASPSEDYSDMSPKGSVDIEIRALVDQINTQPSLVTTSSCAGRVSVFLEGSRSASTSDAIPELSMENGEETRGIVKATRASDGGKGGGGRWLFVSHSPLDVSEESWVTRFGMVSAPVPLGKEDRLVHFKFEPMILHIMTENLVAAQKVLTAAHQAGFRESGVVNVASMSISSSPIVAVRSMGLAFASAIGAIASADSENGEVPSCLVNEAYLSMLVARANERFSANTSRIKRLQELLDSAFSAKPLIWEDAADRRKRKHREGLLRQAATQSERRALQEDIDSANKEEHVMVEGLFHMAG